MKPIDKIKRMRGEGDGWMFFPVIMLTWAAWFLTLDDQKELPLKKGGLAKEFAVCNGKPVREWHVDADQLGARVSYLSKKWEEGAEVNRLVIDGDLPYKAFLSVRGAQVDLLGKMSEGSELRVEKAPCGHAIVRGKKHPTAKIEIR